MWHHLTSHNHSLIINIHWYWQRLCSLCFVTVLQTFCEGPNNGRPSLAKFHEGPDPRTFAGSTPMLGSKGPPTAYGYQMVMWPMTSREPQRCSEAVRSSILATAWLLVIKPVQTFALCAFLGVVTYGFGTLGSLSNIIYWFTVTFHPWLSAD